MQELNYKPNNLARGLQGKSAKLVGLIFPNISNIFYAELIERLEDELFKQGYKQSSVTVSMISTRKKSYLEMPAANQCDGIISSSHNLGIEDYEKVEAPIVAFDRNPPQRSPLSHPITLKGKISRKSSAKGWLSAYCHDYRL